jgi:uncharacterized membrane protein YtjA (UPF0391 family)
MFNLVATLLIIALIAAVLGCGGIAFATCAVPRVAVLFGAIGGRRPLL